MLRILIAISLCALLIPVVACAKSPEQEFVDSAKLGDITALESFLEVGMDLNATGNSGRTALMEAAFATHYETVKFLLNKGAEIDAQDSDGKTALMIALQRGQEDIATLLLQKGADPNIKDNEGLKAMYYARSNEIAQVLRMSGAK